MSQEKPLGLDDQLIVWKALSRSLPVGGADQSFWWKLTGRHLAILMHEAGYSVDRQIESLLFHYFTIVPRLGPQPKHATPGWVSRIGGHGSDGTPIGYSWRWGNGNVAPSISHFVEPIGALTGTPADLLNEVAATELLWEVGKIFPDTDLSLFWKLAPKFKPDMTNDAAPRTSSVLIGFDMAPWSSTVGLTTNIYPRAPKHANELKNVIADAMRGRYGNDVCLDSLNALYDFLAADSDGIQLVPQGTIGIDCSRAYSAGIKCAAVTSSSSFDHIAAIMTLGGRNTVSSKVIDQLHDLWYTLRGLESDFPTSAQLPVLGNVALNGHGTMGRSGSSNPPPLSFHFNVLHQPSATVVKAYFEVGDHAKSDMAAAKVLTGFMERQGWGHQTNAFLSAFQGLLSAKEMYSRSGVLGYISVAIEEGELDISSYINPLAYRRFDEIRADLDKSSIIRQRRSRFE